MTYSYDFTLFHEVFGDELNVVDLISGRLLLTGIILLLEKKKCYWKVRLFLKTETILFTLYTAWMKVITTNQKN